MSLHSFERAFRYNEEDTKYITRCACNGRTKNASWSQNEHFNITRTHNPLNEYVWNYRWPKMNEGVLIRYNFLFKT